MKEGRLFCFVFMGIHPTGMLCIYLWRKVVCFVLYLWDPPDWDASHLCMKEGSFFCFVNMRSTELGCFRLCSWCLWKALDEEACMGLVPWHLDLERKKFLNIDFFSEIYIKSLLKI
jgi:hypothetical protein